MTFFHICIRLDTSLVKVHVKEEKKALLVSAGSPPYLLQVVIRVTVFYHRLKRLNIHKAVCNLWRSVSVCVTYRRADKDGITRLL